MYLLRPSIFSKRDSPKNTLKKKNTKSIRIKRNRIRDDRQRDPFQKTLTQNKNSEREMYAQHTTKEKPRKKKSRSVSYSDPINDRILGDPNWAAKTPEYITQKIEKVFEHSPEDPDILRFSRQHSINVVKHEVLVCFTALKNIEPKAKGRIIVQWTASMQGKIEKLSIGPNLYLRYPSFTNCILENASNLVFDTEAWVDIDVQYPFKLE